MNAEVSRCVNYPLPDQQSAERFAILTYLHTEVVGDDVDDFNACLFIVRGRRW